MGKLLSCNTVKEVGVISPNHYFKKGQILYSKIRPMLNKAVIAPFDGLCSADMYPLETKINSQYFLFYLLSFSYTKQLGMSGDRVKMPKINKEEFYTKIFITPPSDTQECIVSHLNFKMKQIERIELAIKSLISSLTEYRTRLISDVVTGKVDIRGLAVSDTCEEEEKNAMDGHPWLAQEDNDEYSVDALEEQME